MARFTSNFNVEDFMSELEHEVREAVQAEANEHSEDLLADYIGEFIEAVCPGCGHTEMEVIPGGNACCPMCGYTDKVKLELDWGQA